MKAVTVFAILSICVTANVAEVLQRHVAPRLPFDKDVIKAKPINILAWNSIVSLQRGTFAWSHACTGSILTVHFILSAAYCFEMSYSTDWSRPSNWRARVGTANHANGGVHYSLTAVIKHPDWNSNTLDNDIVILRTISQIALSASIGQVIIPTQGAILGDGSWASIAGWGSIVGGSGSTVLHESEVEVVNQKSCSDAYSHWGGVVTDRMHCFGLRINEENVCQGDIGSPIIANRYLHGILSWGHGCIVGGYPSVSTRVSSYTIWIVNTARSS